MNAVLQFIDYHVVEAIFRMDPFANNKNGSLPTKFEYTVDFNPETKLDAWISIAVTMGDEILEDYPIFLRAKIMGRFEIRSDDKLEDAQIMSLYKLNAVAILYPYLRSVVSDLSSKGSNRPIILPTMNIAAMMENEVLKPDRKSVV